MKELLYKEESHSIQYGLSTQKKVAMKTENMLKKFDFSEFVKTEDVIVRLLHEINEFDMEKTLRKKGFWTKILSGDTPGELLMEQFENKRPIIEEKTKELERQHYRMVRETVMLEKEEKEITEIQSELEWLIKTAQEAFEKEKHEYIEKRIYALTLSLHLLRQLESQILSMKSSIHQTTRMIQEIVTNTLPLWKSNLINFLSEIEGRRNIESMTEEEKQKMNQIKEKQKTLLEELERLRNLSYSLKKQENEKE